MRSAKLLCALLGALLLQSGSAFAAQGGPHIALLTTMGSFVVELDPEHAPVSAANFLRYVNEKHFDDTLFYRVVPCFVIQAGSFGADGKGVPPDDPFRSKPITG
jgi:peptidyl-prolyl cis-trans isomerase A (cyclophilin A)